MGFVLSQLSMVMFTQGVLWIISNTELVRFKKTILFLLYLFIFSRKQFSQMKMVSGNRYKGEWRNDHPNGYGELHFASGLRFSGDFKGFSFCLKRKYREKDTWNPTL